MKANNTLTIFVTPLKGDEIRIEKACTLKQAVTLAKKEARKAINNGGMLVFINIQTRGIYDTIETIAHIEAEKEGRRVVFSDEKPAAETYAVCWGVEYTEEEGESNAIAETRDEADAKEFAENESKDNNCRMCVVRKSDGKVIAIYDNTPDNTTPSTSDTMNTETNTVEFSDLSHAAQCLDIYLHNTAEIYERYTVPAIARVVKAYKAGECVSVNPEQLAKDIQEITPAINAAVRLVKKHDHMTPTAKDIEQVTRNFAAYIVESAKYEVENA